MLMNLGSVFVGLTFTLAIAALAAAVVIFVTLRKSKGLWQVGIFFLLEFIYALGYAFELSSSTLEHMMFYNHIQYIAIPFLTPAWLYIALKFNNPKRQLKPWLFFVVMFIPILSFVTAQLSYYTDVTWFYTSWIVDTTQSATTFGITILELSKGLGYYLQMSFNVLLIVVVVLVYLDARKHSRGLKRKQSMALAISALVPTISVIPQLIFPVTFQLDWVLYFSAIVSYGILYVMFSRELFVLSPSAHKATYDLAAEPVLVVDDQFEIVSWNKATEQFRKTGLVHLGFIGDFCLDNDMLVAILDHKSHSFDFEGKHYVMETMPLRNKTSEIIGNVIKLNDMTAYAERIGRLEYEATHDSLTKILNRRAFFDGVGKWYAKNANAETSVAVMMIDIDDFKPINDTYGHSLGDVVLSELSEIFTKNWPKGSLFARYGGEEFVTFIPKMDRQAAQALGSKLCQIIADHVFEIGDVQLNVHVSIGIAVQSALSEKQMNEMLIMADVALYQAKKTGKNRAIVSQ